MSLAVMVMVVVRMCQVGVMCDVCERGNGGGCDVSDMAK